MNLERKDIVIFDLDGTLAPSKSNLEPDMAELLVELLGKKKVAVVSGGSYEQFKTQFLEGLPENEDKFSNLILMPTSGTRMDIWDHGKWVEKYAELLSPEEKEKVMRALDEALVEGEYEKPEKTFGDLIEDRGSQITFSALGQKAPVELKSVWDKDHRKREKIVIPLKNKIPEFAISINANTSIDITRAGVDKGYAIHKIRDIFNIPIERMLFVGDAIFPGGNDYPAKEAGVDCINVKDPEETKNLIHKWLTE